MIAEFPSIETACKWYESSPYQAVAQRRFKGAVYTWIIVQGVAASEAE